MAIQTILQFWLLAWLVVAGVIVYRHARPEQSAGLMLSYVFSLGVLHWFPATLYLLPWGDNVNRELTIDGLQQAVFAVVGLAVGAEFAVRAWHGRHRIDGGVVGAVSPRMVTLYLLGGALMYGPLFAIAGRLPTVRALISTGGMLLVVGVGLKCWVAWQENNRTSLWFWLSATVVFPLVTVATQGFLGYGFGAMVLIFGFFASFYRPRWQPIVLGMLLGYLGLSVYVTYMRDRGDIRDIVWQGGSASESWQRMVRSAGNFEWFDWNNMAHLGRVDDRLNQGMLVGAAVDYLRSGHAEFARGGTFIEAALAVVPRALWPEKSVSAGSGDTVSHYTGIRFGEDTSVGIGQVLECYINFGTAGVFGGFFVIGSLLVLADGAAAAHLRRGDSSAFLMWYLPGLSLLQVGGSLTEVTASAGAACVLAVVFRQVGRALGVPSPLPARYDVADVGPEVPEDSGIDIEPKTIMSMSALAAGVNGAASPVEVGAAAPASDASLTEDRIDLNAATHADLVELPGVSARLAARIVDYRQRNGGIKTVEELLMVKGIGKKTLVKLRGSVWVAPGEPLT